MPDQPSFYHLMKVLCFSLLFMFTTFNAVGRELITWLSQFLKAASTVPCSFNSHAIFLFTSRNLLNAGFAWQVVLIVSVAVLKLLRNKVYVSITACFVNWNRNKMGISKNILKTRLKTLILLLIMLCAPQESICWTNPTYQRVSKSKVTNALIRELYPLFHVYMVHRQQMVQVILPVK